MMNHKNKMIRGRKGFTDTNWFFVIIFIFTAITLMIPFIAESFNENILLEEDEGYDIEETDFERLTVTVRESQLFGLGDELFTIEVTDFVNDDVGFVGSLEDEIFLANIYADEGIINFVSYETDGVYDIHLEFVYKGEVIEDRWDHSIREKLPIINVLGTREGGYYTTSFNGIAGWNFGDNKVARSYQTYDTVLRFPYFEIYDDDLIERDTFWGRTVSSETIFGNYLRGISVMPTSFNLFYFGVLTTLIGYLFFRLIRGVG